ncbi:MAG: hypothetical protein G3M70_17385 [Candidatus Nitronauta litoralis]|uniref:Uncharacterized protein n=1 Tax=Candidatus Nitronauta litoralis TaxID=2705533 RepID=A0A7T0BZ30_9BACT|nr:MAG: hypothetical protein G3M70_17385 [Candidatus Nitronauta litoralis]
MLIFKTNIYENESSPNPFSNSVKSLNEALHLSKFIESSLKDDLSYLENFDHCQEGLPPEELENFYPKAHKFAKSSMVQRLLAILIEGLNDQKTWYRMNTYHFCLLYDCLKRQVYLYNTDDLIKKLRLCPEMKGKNIQFEKLIERLFFNTVFLMDKEQYDFLSHEDKIELGFTCPSEFGVLHGLIPNLEEMKLLPEPGFSYTMGV